MLFMLLQFGLSYDDSIKSATCRHPLLDCLADTSIFTFLYLSYCHQKPTTYSSIPNFLFSMDRLIYFFGCKKSRYGKDHLIIAASRNFGPTYTDQCARAHPEMDGYSLSCLPSICTSEPERPHCSKEYVTVCFLL